MIKGFGKYVIHCESFEDRLMVWKYIFKHNFPVEPEERVDYELLQDYNEYPHIRWTGDRFMATGIRYLNHYEYNKISSKKFINDPSHGSHLNFSFTRYVRPSNP